MARNPATHRNYMRGYMARRREDMKNKGICPRCCKRPAESGMVCCQECIDNIYDKQLKG